jgi:hypothetical protein
MEGCLESTSEDLSVTPETYCECSYREIVDTIPFEEFKEINSNLSDEPAALPAEMQAIVEECASSQ